MTDLREPWWRDVLAGPDGRLEYATPSGDALDVEKYVVLPRVSDPRVIVDQSCSLGMSDAIGRMISTRSTNPLLAQIGHGVAPLVSKKTPNWFVSSPSEQGTLRSYLSEVLGEDVTISISVGPPRVNRKPVVRCYGSSGLIAVAKLGPDPHTSLMTRNEARWLRELMSQPIEGIKTPDLLFAGTFGNSDLIVMEALDLINDTGVDLADMPMNAMDCFTARYFDPQSVLSNSAWWKTLATRLGVLSTPLGPTLERLGADPNFDELDVSAWHGDFSPWNLGHTTSGALAIWDWERTAIGVPTGFDVLHLHYQYGNGLDQATIGLAELGVRSGHHRLLQGLYLVELCARSAEAFSTGTLQHHKVMRELHRLEW